MKITRFLLLFLIASSAHGEDLVRRDFSGPDGELLERVEYRGKDPRPFRKLVFRTKYGTPAVYEAVYETESPSDFRLKEVKISPPEALSGTDPVAHLKAREELRPRDFSSKPPAALIIDSGFFPSHPLLRGKHFLDPESGAHTLRGTLVAGGAVRYTRNENEILLMPDGGRGGPFSHGTSVASIAMRGINHASFIGAAGDIFATAYLYKMIDLIRDHGIRFTNMSFGFGDSQGASLIDPSDHEALENFVRFQPEVLHVIASGNHGVNFDETKFSEAPACIRSLNSVVVGGLAADRIEEAKLRFLERSPRASHGVRCVDIMAPAENVAGAWLWPETAPVSGTSVAAPFVLNVLLQMHAVNPALGPRVFRELLLKTAYVPRDKVFAVRSGGIVHPRRALLATRLLSSGRSLQEAVFESRRQISDEAEINDEASLEALWSRNRLQF